MDRPDYTVNQNNLWTHDEVVAGPTGFTYVATKPEYERDERCWLVTDAKGKEVPPPKQMSDDKLQPCPWCKQQDVGFEIREVSWKHDAGTCRRTVAVCIRCGAQGPAFGPLSVTGERTAAIYWNTRTPDPRLAELQAEVEANQRLVQHLVATLADEMQWNWTRQGLSERCAADAVLRLMAQLGLIEHQRHPSGGDVWTVNGKRYGRTDGLETSAALAQSKVAK